MPQGGSTIVNAIAAVDRLDRLYRDRRQHRRCRGDPRTQLHWVARIAALADSLNRTAMRNLGSVSDKAFDQKVVPRYFAVFLL
jgi:hypothetical protein